MLLTVVSGSLTASVTGLGCQLVWGARTAKASEVNSISQVMCGEFQLSDVILIQGFLCSCDRNKSSKCYRRVHGEVYKGISWEDEPCIKAFWWFCKADLLAISGAKQFTCFGTCFQANRRGKGVGGEGGLQEEGGNYLWELLFCMCEFERIVSWLSLG